MTPDTQPQPEAELPRPDPTSAPAFDAEAARTAIDSASARLTAGRWMWTASRLKKFGNAALAEIERLSEKVGILERAAPTAVDVARAFDRTEIVRLRNVVRETRGQLRASQLGGNNAEIRATFLAKFDVDTDQLCGGGETPPARIDWRARAELGEREIACLKSVLYPSCTDYLSYSELRQRLVEEIRRRTAAEREAADQMRQIQGQLSEAREAARYAAGMIANEEASASSLFLASSLRAHIREILRRWPWIEAEKPEGDST